MVSWLYRPFQNFLSLATQKPNAIENILGYSFKKDVNEQPNELEEEEIEVIFPKYYIRNDAEEDLHPQKMLFSYRDISSDFPEIINKWLSLSEELRSVVNLFFGVQYNDKLYLENKFLNVVQAAETYHRRRYKESGKGEEHQNKLDAILKAVPEEYKVWLETKLQYSHEPSLSQRLKQITKEVDAVIKPLFRKKDSFIQKVVDTRNYLTHYDPSREQQAAKGESLLILTQTLSIMLQACLLHELGISNERCIEFFQRSEMYKYVLSKK